MNIPFKLVQKNPTFSWRFGLEVWDSISASKRSDYHHPVEVGCMVDAWADVETAIESAVAQRQQRLDRLTSASALALLTGALWLMWPSLDAAIRGEPGLLNGLGLSLIHI